MGFLKVYRSGRVEDFRSVHLSDSANIKGRILDMKIETCFYIQYDESKCTDNKWMEILMRILGDHWEANLGLRKQSIFSNLVRNQTVIEVGPRLNFSTPWSTNCLSICKSLGLNQVERLEKASRYLLTFMPNLLEIEIKRVINSLYDSMTQQIYEKPLETLFHYKSPEKWSRIDVVGGGRKSLEEANLSMGLAFDDWDMDYYTRLFQEDIGRNPSTVELFDLAQSNSEHSRHWFFKGVYELDGRKLDRSLLDMVMDTNTLCTTNQNNVIKFTDNSSGIVGWEVPLMIPSDPKNSSAFCLTNRLRHIIFTAETHNFPTGVSPFSGATTGTGGRIRDVQAAGKGGHVIAGTAGYCYGNLNIPGYPMPWERFEISPSNFASPIDVLIGASNGASDYGNKFGEPIICGFSRSFGMIWGNEDLNERREWIKPIMFSGGIGSLDENMVHKIPPSESQLVVKLGGPAYRIGVGGGAASSVQVQGDNTLTRDLGAVQRGDPEMEQKLNRVIRACLEMDSTPILAIHDQGAGGNANVLKELMEGAGGVIFTKAFTLGDPTLSTLEIWGAEYQESNALLVNPSQFSVLENLCSREKCPVDKVGYITNDGKVRLYETEFTENPKPDDENLPVNLKLDWVLGNMPKKVFKWTKNKVIPKPLGISTKEEIFLSLKRVLYLPSVASKRYLTTKVDRSVTGLVAQQQCVGPLHTPLADVAVNAISYFSKKGAATSIGEQPIKILINPKAGARMTVLEALSNLVSCLITDILDVKCSANWMWAAKLDGEGYALYEACESMCGLMMMLGIGVDGGKDSLSMAARVPHPTNPSESSVVKAPGSLVISAYAPCPDITKVITPDLKSPGNNTSGCLILIKPAFEQFRVGGSALAQVYSQTGFECPDVNEEQIYKFINCFKAIQHLIKQNLILSLHDISDGGLVVCLIEMAIAGWGGIDVQIPECQAELISEASSIYCEYFNEEVGWVAEIDVESVSAVMDIFKEHKLEDVVRIIGCTTSPGPDAKINFIYRDDKKCPVISLSVAEAAQMWEQTSYRLERLQTNPELAREEYKSLLRRKHTKENIKFTWNKNNFSETLHRHPSTPIMAVIREEGSNGDRELVAAFIQAGFIVHDVTMSDLMDRVVNLDQFRGIAFPGGFSYADVLGSGVGWASSIKEREELNKALEKWRNKRTTFSLGVCNGCQLLALLGWIGIDNSNTYSVRLDPNNSNRFESRWSRVKIRKSNSILLKGMENSTLGIWVAHGEGKFTFKNNNIKEILLNKSCVALQYVNDDNKPTENYPFNPNGSEDGIAGMTSICGRHLALMPHPERCVLTWQCPTTKPSNPQSSLVAPWSKLFQNAFDWCLKTI